MLNQNNLDPLDGPTSTQLAEDTAFNAMIWSLSLIGTGNNDYQNSFYDKQAEKIIARYENIII